MKRKEWVAEHYYVLLLLPGVVIIVLFMVVPLAWILRISFYEKIPGGYMKAAWILDNYKRFLGDAWYLKNILWLSFAATVFCSMCSLILAYPVALASASRARLQDSFRRD